MSAVDFERAVEMARAIPIKTINGNTQSSAHFDALRKLAQFIALDPVKRSILRFERWNRSDTWSPAYED
jgi:hypothetical protein